MQRALVNGDASFQGALSSPNVGGRSSCHAEFSRERWLTGTRPRRKPPPNVEMMWLAWSVPSGQASHSLLSMRKAAPCAWTGRT